jgi:nucleoside-diphosphate-sugar epimerase
MNPIEAEESLEAALSRPTPEVAKALEATQGDLLVLGVAGKMGPTLARMARRALDLSGSKRQVIGAARFSNPKARDSLEKAGVRTVACNLLEREEVQKLPEAGAVVFMAGMKFGSTGAEAETWAANSYLPGLVAERYSGRPTVVFSTGNVYPFVPAGSRGADERTPPAPVGEYAQSALGRERIFEYFSRKRGTPTVIYRLNYAVELRYGILLDVAEKVWSGAPVNIGMGYVNVIWQGDANAIALRCLAAAQSPPAVFNVTGPEALSVRSLAIRFAEIFGKVPLFEGREEPTALLSDASEALRRFGPLAVPLETMIGWVAAWVRKGGPTLRKPTHFETRDGKF